jgi:hypothetical protein
MMADYWFRPHTYGYGATPANGKGWAAVAGFIAVSAALTGSVLALPADLPGGPGAWQIVTLIVMQAALAAWFIRLGRRRTDGQWAWRWGKQR